MEKNNTNKLLVVAIILMMIICGGVLYLVYVQLTSSESKGNNIVEPVRMEEEIIPQEIVETEIREEASTEAFEIEEWYESEDESFYEDSLESDYYEEQEVEPIDHLTIPDYMEGLPPVRTMPLIRFDGVLGEWGDTELEHGLLFDGSGLVEIEHLTSEFGQDATIYFNVKNLSEEFSYTLSFQDLYIDDVPFDDDAFYHANLHSEHHAGSTLAPGEETSLLLNFSEFSMMRKDKFSPFPTFEKYMYGELVVNVRTVGVRAVDDDNFETFFVPFTMPLY